MNLASRTHPSAAARTKFGSPITGEVIAKVAFSDAAAASAAIGRAQTASLAWRKVPAPRRGELVRLFGEELRAAKTALGRLVTLEVGKITSEGLGEVQEMIDICDYAVGLSRQLYGLTIATERANHRMMETWHPLGVVGIISAFNFPVAVWAWNAALALVCGNAVVWKPSEKTPLTALATQALFERAARKFGDVPDGLSCVLVGGREVGEALVDDPRVPLVSATGSTAMGRAVGPRLARRFARALLELGGNNAAIVCPSADLDLALRAIAFAAMGTAGQRCTTLRRLIVHESVYDKLVPRLRAAYGSVAIGDPREGSTLIGPLIDRRAFEGLQAALRDVSAAGGTVTGGQRVLAERFPEAYYVKPALAEIRAQEGPVMNETFAPLLYVMKYRDVRSGAADAQRRGRRACRRRCSPTTCARPSASCRRTGRIAASPTSTSARRAPRSAGRSAARRRPAAAANRAPIRWRAYMRRATNTINYGTDLPLAQGVKFEIG